jgi:hypothetical protein
MLSPEEQISAITRAAFEEAGPILVNEVRQEISRAYPPSSDPGTPPHLRTGDLALGVRSSVDTFWTGVTLTLISEAEYSIYLRDGSSRMEKRDYMGDEAAQRYAPIVVDILQKHFGFSATPLPRLAELFNIEFDTAA